MIFRLVRRGVGGNSGADRALVRNPGCCAAVKKDRRAVGQSGEIAVFGGARVIGVIDSGDAPSQKPVKSGWPSAILGVGLAAAADTFAALACCAMDTDTDRSKNSTSTAATDTL